MNKYLNLFDKNLQNIYSKYRGKLVMLSKTKKTLLLVEDEAILALSTKRDLIKYGYNVLVVNTGKKAINICKENCTIDLILMDIDLGQNIDGTKAAELILKDNDLPILFLSSHTEPEIVDKTEKITSYGYVVKSSSITVLNASIKMAFKLFEAHEKIDESEKKYRKLYENSPLGYQSLSSEGNFVEIDGNASYNSKGEFKQTHCVIRNVSDHQQAEKNLRDLFISEEKFKAFTNQATEGITVADMEGNYTFVNPAFCKMSGYSERELLEMTVFDMKAENQPNKSFYDSKEKMEGIPIQVNLQRKDKTEYLTEITGKVIKVGKNNLVLGTIRDITDRHKAEKELIENKEKFSKAFFNHPVAMQILNIKTGQRIDMNEKCIELFGINKKEFQKGNIYTNNISADPVSRKLIIEKLIQNKTVTNMPLDIINTTGEIKNLLASGSILNIDNGELGIFSYIDITDSKKSDLELIKSEEKYRRLVENMSDDYFFYTHDTAGIITYLSPSVTSMLGYSKKDFMDHYSKYFTDSPINDNSIKCTKKSIEGIKQKPYLVEVYHKNGSTRIQEISETPVFDENGKVFAVEGLAHDITEIKKTENEIKHQLQEKEIILKEVHHRIKNNFASISSLLSLHVQETANPDAISALQDAIGRVNSMQLLYEKLLITENYNFTSARDYFSSLIDDIIKLFSKAINVTINKDIDDFNLTPKKLVPVGIIVNELLTNIMKYAFKESGTGSIKVSIKEKSGKIALIIQDNGIGLSKSFDLNKQTGFGLMLVKMLSEQLKGNFSIENNNGTKSSLEFSI